MTQVDQYSSTIQTVDSGWCKNTTEKSASPFASLTDVRLWLMFGLNFFLLEQNIALLKNMDKMIFLYISGMSYKNAFLLRTNLF